MRTRPAAPWLALLAFLLAAAPVVAADRDEDGLRDGFEVRWGVTDPDRRDSDRDGIVDPAEDSDGDGLGNLGEQRFGMDPGTRDSDGDGLSDGNDDSDADGRRDGREQDRRPVPRGLVPSLPGARYDRSGVNAGCHTRQGSAALVRCYFGDLASPRTIVLLGDSHAMMWVLPVMRTAEREGLRLVTLFKGGCSPVLGTKRVWDCSAWRRAALAWLNEQPADLVIIAHSDDYALVDRDGRRTPVEDRPAVWREGMVRTLAALPETSEVLLLGDVPDNRRIPAECLAEHRFDMSACQTARQPRAERAVERALKEVAATAGALHRSLYGWICTYDPCPLVQGSVFMWRDRSHITATIAKRLTPSMRRLVVSALPEAR